MTAIELAEKTCANCETSKPLAEFAVDRSRADGRTYWCSACRNARAKRTYTPQRNMRPGRRYVAARDDDRKQARRRVNHLIDMGLLPAPNAVPCVDCGHVWSRGERRHEYDHHCGYAADHHEDVEALCTTCHHAREQLRRAA